MLPDAFLARGADILGTVRITAPDEFLDLLAEGGSAPHFLGHCGREDRVGSPSGEGGREGGLKKTVIPAQAGTHPSANSQADKWAGFRRDDIIGVAENGADL